MSYESRKKCDLKHITGCGLCPQMFDCPYDKNENKSENIKTESEKQQLFDALAKENKRWDAEKKAIVDLKQEYEFKPFDKVLCRRYKGDKWKCDHFSHYSKNTLQPYCCISGQYRYCIPYEGNEYLLNNTKQSKDN